MGNNQTSGYGSFIDRKKIIPNGIELLPKLLKKKSRTKFLQNYVAIWKIKDWSHLKKILNSSITKEVQMVLKEVLRDGFNPRTFNLQMLISLDPAWEKKQANQEDAKRLGSFFTEELIGDHNSPDMEKNPWKNIIITLSQIKFQSQVKQWKEPKELFFKTSNSERVRPNLETLICGFALQMLF